MPILPDDDAMYFVMGGPQINPSICRTKLGTGGNSEDEIECAKNTEQPTSEEACKAALRACLEALEVAQGYVESSGWTRHRDDETSQVESAITNARKALE